MSSGRWGGGVFDGNQFRTFDAESKFAKIPNSHVWLGESSVFFWGGMETNFQLLILSPNLLKPQIPMSGGGRGGLVETNFQLLMLSPNLLKSQIPCLVGGSPVVFFFLGGGWKPISNF